MRFIFSSSFKNFNKSKNEHEWTRSLDTDGTLRCKNCKERYLLLVYLYQNPKCKL